MVWGFSFFFGLRVQMLRFKALVYGLKGFRIVGFQCSPPFLTTWNPKP